VGVSTAQRQRENDQRVQVEHTQQMKGTKRRLRPIPQEYDDIVLTRFLVIEDVCFRMGNDDSRILGKPSINSLFDLD